MNTHWLTLPKERRIEILNQATAVTGLPASAIEKDWWVTLCLNAAFSLPYSANIVFKGGTSLSKSWSLIDRFSEDIDLAIDRTFFGFDEDISKSQIKKLRKQSCAFISTQFLNDLKQTITDWGAATEWKILAQQAIDSDKVPQILEVRYDSVLDSSEYLPQRVLIEVGSRSLMEPTEMREINSILSTAFRTQSFATASFAISTVLPQRTFVEKIFLLHEEFSQPPKKIRVDRMSRHLYDLERLSDTEHGTAALQNTALYDNIVAHRSKFNPIRGLDYNNHTPDKIKIVPPESIVKEYERDYGEMATSMIHGEPLTFQNLMQRIIALQARINEMSPN
jgi:hypothetical protein